MDLSHQHVRFFREQGYLRLPAVLGLEECKTLRDFVLEERAAEDRRRAASGQGRATKLYGLYDRNPEAIGRVIRHPVLITALQTLLGPNVVFVKNRHNHATVNDSRGTKADSRLHRDILQPTRGLITLAVYLEPSSIENGCTHIIPGSQFFPLVGVPQPDGGGTWMDEHPEYTGFLDQALPVPMPRGGALLFDGLAFHMVGDNQTEDTRVSMTFGFRAADELDLQPDPTRQMLVAGSHIYRGNDA